MDTARSQNLKKVLDAVPAGYLVDAAWLVSQGIAYESFRDYVKRGWLERIARGVFRRPVPNMQASNSIDWKTCILSMQHIMGHDLHVGSTTALGEQGHAHYLRLGESAPVWVYGDKVPNWLIKLPTDAPFSIRPVPCSPDPKLGVIEGKNSGLAMGLGSGRCRRRSAQSWKPWTSCPTMRVSTRSTWSSRA